MKHLLAPIIMGLCLAQAVCAGSLESEPLSVLENKLRILNAELGQLASYSLRGGVGNVGYRSLIHESQDATEWIRIDLGAGAEFDQIVLVPTIWRDTKAGFRADAFPVEFRIIAGKYGDKGLEIACFTKEDRILPRIAPLVIPVEKTVADWVKVEAVELAARAWDGQFILQLSEIFVFDGEDDIALRRPVTVFSEDKTDGIARDKNYLVDGLVPYLMDAQTGDQSVAMLSVVGVGDHPAFTIDLGAKHSVDRIHLHEVDVSDSVPQVMIENIGFPKHLVIEGASDSAFSDVVKLAEFRAESPYDAGPIVMLRFPEKECRYVRFTAEEPFINKNIAPGGSQIGFAEVEILSSGRNVALGKDVIGDYGMISPNRSLSAVTNGLNLYGEILPVRRWLGELGRRHDLEVERPQIMAELDLRYARQKVTLSILGWLAVVLAFGIVSLVFLHRIVTMRRMEIFREKLAADLHDELGGNLHTIGLLSDLAEKSGDGSEKMANLHRRIRSETERSATAVRHCTDILGTKELYSDFIEDMHRSSRRIMARLEHKISVSGVEFIQQQKPRIRAGLFLFYKESLVNISKHSGATEYRTNVTADHRMIIMEIRDNGRGLPGGDGVDSLIPASLKRRARLLGAKVSATSLPDSGTRITLRLKTGIWSRILRS